MLTLSPAAFLERRDFCRPFPCADHHVTGPPSTWQSENNGSVFHIEGQILAALAARLGGPVLEIGADLGISTRYIHEGLARTEKQNLRIYSVDNHHKWDEDPGWPLRVPIDADSTTYRPPEPCTWAFCDGDHRYDGVFKDCGTLLRAGIPHLLFHDTGAHHAPASNQSCGSDARRAVLDFFTPLPHWELIDVQSPCGLLFAYQV